MDNSHWVTWFLALAIVATFLLWGISLLNGTVWALSWAVWHGQLGTDQPLQTVYTGIPILDYPIALLVAFFFYGTNGYDEGYQLFLLDAYATLQSAFVWLYVEAIRPSEKSSLVQRPVVFGLLWQCFGGAISLPLYYACHLQWLQAAQFPPPAAVSLYKAKALPFAFIFGAVLPAVICMAPTWLGHDSRHAVSHQRILAAWQPDPIWVSLILTFSSAAFTRLKSPGSKMRAGRARSDDTVLEAHKWMRTSYLLAAISTAVGHFYVVYRVITTQNPQTTLWRMYVPADFVHLEGVHHILVEGPWLFLKYDLIMISFSSITWAYYVSTRAGGGVAVGKGLWLLLTMICGAVLIGPGAVVSLALYRRERILFLRRNGKTVM